MPNKILIVDDEPEICEILEFNLVNEGFEVQVAFSAEEAETKLDDSFSLILLDVMMGGISGYKFAEQIRKKGETIPIVFLTAKSNENEMLTGFSVGADDYITKPFSVKEVVARLKAILKRAPQKQIGSIPNELNFDHLTIDSVLKEITIDGNRVELTKKEFEIILLLAQNPERIFSREDIIENLWKDTPFITVRTVDVHITRLRKKMGDYAYMISNRSGYGYRFNTIKK
jgi:DNA-binding response OmpR family regulator